jgi:hypothetical protein
MYCDVWRDINLCETNLCDRRLTRIVKTCAEKGTFTVTKPFEGMHLAFGLTFVAHAGFH